MSFFKNFFHLFLFSSAFICVCAVLMAVQTYYLFNLPVNYYYLGFTFFGTLSSYNFHWYFTPVSETASKKNNWVLKFKKLHFILLILGVCGAVYCAFYLKQHLFWLTTVAFLTFLYSAPKLGVFHFLRKIAFGKTIFLALVWTHVTCLLPVIFSGAEWTNQYSLFALNRFLFIYAVCILFDYRDREADKAEGIRSMVTAFSDAATNRLFWASIITCILTFVFLYSYNFSLLTIIALLIPVVIVGILYEPAKKSRSDYLYYFVLDGLMMLSFLLLLVFRF